MSPLRGLKYLLVSTQALAVLATRRCPSGAKESFLQQNSEPVKKSPKGLDFMKIGLDKVGGVR